MIVAEKLHAPYGPDGYIIPPTSTKAAGCGRDSILPWKRCEFFLTVLFFGGLSVLLHVAVVLRGGPSPTPVMDPGSNAHVLVLRNACGACGAGCPGP
jgi:hypothetical protein